MRKIKFRAWDGKRMVSAIYPKSNYKFEVDWDGKFKLFRFETRSKVEYEDCEEIMLPDWEEVEDASIMQFTGENDIEGMNIYDGDILLDHYGNKRKVYWSDVFGQWRITDHDESLYRMADGCKVIGNIYEGETI